MADHAGLKVQFLFDFGSPNAYLAAKVIPDVEKRTGVRFEYVPALLGGRRRHSRTGRTARLRGRQRCR